MITVYTFPSAIVECGCAEGKAYRKNPVISYTICLRFSEEVRTTCLLEVYRTLVCLGQITKRLQWLHAKSEHGMSATPNNAMLRTTIARWNDSDESCATEDNDKPTTVRRHYRVFVQTTYLYTKWRDSRLVAYIQFRGIRRMFELCGPLLLRFSLTGCLYKSHRRCTGLNYETCVYTHHNDRKVVLNVTIDWRIRLLILSSSNLNQ